MEWCERGTLLGPAAVQNNAPMAREEWGGAPSPTSEMRFLHVQIITIYINILIQNFLCSACCVTMKKMCVHTCVVR